MIYLKIQFFLIICHSFNTNQKFNLLFDLVNAVDKVFMNIRPDINIINIFEVLMYSHGHLQARLCLHMYFCFKHKSN